jgi:hypothetical protein
MKIYSIILLVILFTPASYASNIVLTNAMEVVVVNDKVYDVLTDEECLEIISAYKINPKIKSARGWNRVFKSKKWKKIFLLDNYTAAEIDCLKHYIVANAMNVKKYDRFIGMEMGI